jgi:hypothetical protein
MPDQPHPSAFRTIVTSRLVQVLAVIAALLLITTEAVVLYNSVQQGRVAQQEVEIKRQINIYAPKRQSAEAHKKTAEATTAKAVAINASELTGAEEKLTRHKAEVAREAAANAEKLKLAAAQLKEAEATIAAAVAVYAERKAKADAVKTGAEAKIRDNEAYQADWLARHR